MRRYLIGLVLLIGFSGSISSNSYQRITAQLKEILQKDSVHARSIADNMLKKDKKNPDLAAAIGTAFLHKGRIEDAEYFYDKGYHMQRISPNIINLAGDIALAKNDRQKAEYYYSRAIYFNKRAPEAYYKYARLYAKTNPEKAIHQLEVLKQYRHDTDIDLKIAGIFYDNAQYSKAAPIYARIPIDSLNKETLTNFALSYYFQQKFDSSLVVTHKGVLNYPRHPAFNRMLLYNNT